MSDPSLPLSGLTVCVTGEVAGLDRKQAQEAVLALGGQPVGSVSGRTGLVVVGEGAGVSKMSKVVQFKVPVLLAEEFLSLAADPDSASLPVGHPYVDPDQPNGPEKVVLGDHLVGKAVVYPNGKQETRMWCACGQRWLGAPMDPLVCPSA